MDIVIKVAAWLGDIVFALLSVFSPVAVLWIISALIGLGMMLAWRYTSNQKAIADVRAKISAHLLATRLFKDNLSVTFRAQRQILWQAIRLLGHSLRPMAVMTVPFILILAQMGLRFEHRPPAVGEATRVTAILEPGVSVGGVGDELHLPAGLTISMNDPCRVQPLGTVDWRIKASSPGHYTLAFGVDSDRVEMPLHVGDGFVRISPRRGGGFLDRVLYSAEPTIPEASAFEAIRIHYPKRSSPICGLDVHWLVSLLILSIVFALIFKPFLKVHT